MVSAVVVLLILTTVIGITRKRMERRKAAREWNRRHEDLTPLG